ncbi:MULTISPECIES: guanine deaminase [unclassified Agarivorans]|uniref:guanine deaminase n=1 Tax=unclassified Agarivorans TaxID=2636026 RepID=UPI0026E3A184|nr:MULTISPECIES: guanine deaminase [unclassified Agarivorans]MDO6687076.1 guanine deaminase [Agarivorans sp. 3_MG-2023]MDO6713512.1 guanine deaminase [Agarivorans sp. 2_MG-2023]
MTRQIHRGSILHFPKASLNPSEHYQYWEDGVLMVKHGLIAHLGDAKDFLQAETTPLAQLPIVEHQGLIIPGLIDSHVHYPQVEVIASFGKQLLDWLNTYTFPAEQQFIEAAYARGQAEFFLQQLFAHGTTTASVYATVHPQSVTSFFEAAQSHNARMICGKVLMDRNCPAALQDTPDSGYYESKQLIEQWHKNGRQLYAITPRFAPTSSEAQLAKAGQLANEHPDTFIQTHLSENPNEVQWINELFPDYSDYLAVYEAHDLVREKSLFGHGIHLTDREYIALAASGATINFCPSSNLFLGSGLFNYQRAQANGVSVALASDVGGGTSLSMFANQADAYKVCQLQQTSLSPFDSLYLCTQGAAVAMGVDTQVGNLNVGSEADFVELDMQPTPMLSQRLNKARDLSEQLFAINTLGDDRMINATYVAGKQVYKKGQHYVATAV